ncbi:MAG: peptide ABC transporter ATP-binding protein [Chloroflexi bacterium]|nr:MAG: peptide ABC transporter ATP-binding protein [Chloroflexota bacterium]
MTSEPLLDLTNLSIAYRTGNRWIEAVRDVTLRIARGQTYGLVGESGSGKSTLALAAMRYLSSNGKVTQGTIHFGGLDLQTLPEEEMRSLWGKEMALVPQDPLSSLNPSIRVGEQVAEILRHHLSISAAEAQQQTLDLLTMVRLPDPERIARSYPHQISGGMQQRVLIASALSLEPQLLVLDEPTTGLDVTTEAAILDLFGELIAQGDTAALFVTHDLGVVARTCDRVAVLYAGELVEDAPTTQLFTHPLHPYTQGLLDSIPRLGQRKDRQRLRGISGQIPSLNARPDACVFAPRCPLAIDRCHAERPESESPAPGRQVRCHRWPEIMEGSVDAHSPDVAASNGDRPAEGHALDIDGLKVHFPLSRGLGRRPGVIKAVDGVDLALEQGQTLGLVGESGSGKTTLARAVVGLVERTAGEIKLLDVPLARELNRRDATVLRQLQMVFQNPDEALNPYLTVRESVSRPLIRLLGYTRDRAERAVLQLLEAVRLAPEYADRLPSQLSGGEKQRVAIARAFAANPALLLCDEAVSALDVSVQASILNLLNELQTTHNIGMVFISHDLAVVSYLADQIAVMYLGQLMEVADTDALLQPPYHPYTEALLSAVAIPDPTVRQAPIRLEGDVPSQLDVPSGCPFHTRCPRFLGEICRSETPPWRVDETTGARIFCHIPLAELCRDQQPLVPVEPAAKS